jgi:hypothetical protein
MHGLQFVCNITAPAPWNHHLPSPAKYTQIPLHNAKPRLCLFRRKESDPCVTTELHHSHVTVSYHWRVGAARPRFHAALVAARATITSPSSPSAPEELYQQKWPTSPWPRSSRNGALRSQLRLLVPTDPTPTVRHLARTCATMLPTPYG